MLPARAVTLASLAVLGAAWACGEQLRVAGDDPSPAPDAAADDDATDAGLPPGNPVVEISAHSVVCARTQKGWVYCWGGNRFGGAGVPPANDGPCTVQPCVARPTRVSGVTGATAIAVGVEHACAIVADGTVLCWGSNQFASLATGGADIADNPTPHPTPTPVPNIGRALAISAGREATCAIVGTDGGREVRCWGMDDNALYGVLPTPDAGTHFGGPTRIQGADGATAVRVSTYDGVACALLSDAHVACWGTDRYGVLGPSEPPATQCGGVGCSAEALPIESVDALSIGVGDLFACALTRGDGKVLCWGFNGVGALGLGIGKLDKMSHPVPTEVAGLSGIDELAVGYTHVCARKDRVVRCWGANFAGELADVGDPVCDGYKCTAAPALLGLSEVDHVWTGNRTTFIQRHGRIEAFGMNAVAALGHAPGRMSDGDCSSFPCNRTPQPIEFPPPP